MKNEIIAVIFACSLPLIVIVIAVILYLSYKNDKREEKWLREEENKYCERISSLLNNIGFVAKNGFYENGKTLVRNDGKGLVIIAEIGRHSTDLKTEHGFVLDGKICYDYNEQDTQYDEIVGESNINNLLVLYNDCESNKKYRKLKMREDRRNSNNANYILVPALTIIMSVLLVIAICNM